MKANLLEYIPKENVDCNREKEDKVQGNKNNKTAEEVEYNRAFGKNIKNSVNNSNNYGALAKKNNKNQFMIQKNKVPPKENSILVKNAGSNNNIINVTTRLNHKDEALKSLAVLEKNLINSHSNQDDSHSLSQIIQEANQSSSQQLKEYKDLALAGENILQIKENKVFNDIPAGGETMVKVGNFFVRKSLGVQMNNERGVGLLNVNVSSSVMSNTNESLRVRSNLQILEKYDRNVEHDPQYVVEVVKEIFVSLKENEKINSAQYGYLGSIQDSISDKMRALLIDWIIEVHMKFKLNPETLYLTVNLIDRYLNIHNVKRDKLQLLAVGSMLIASKYEEIYAPEVRDFVYITDRTYTKNEILDMEYKILSTLDFDILHVSPYTFLRRYHFITGDDLKSFYLAQFILEFSLLEYKMLLHTSSLKAASCLFISRKLLKIDQPWPLPLVTATGYQENDIKHCARDMCKILELIPRITLQACLNKFSSAKYMEVAKINLFN